MKFTNLLVAGLVLTVAASGCRKKPTVLTPMPKQDNMVGEPKSAAQTPQGPGNATPFNQPEGPQGNTPRSTEIPSATKSGGFAQGPGHDGWKEAADALKSQTIHFAYDSSAIQAMEQGKVQAVADALRNNQAAAVRVEGNCDERGTEEYNRSLGERRALAVREELIKLGIDATRVDTVSYGEDRPVDPTSNEAAWRKNRRADFILLTPPQ